MRSIGDEQASKSSIWGEEPMTASGRNLIGSEVNRSKRAAQWAVAPTEVAEYACHAQAVSALALVTADAGQTKEASAQWANL